MAAWIPTSTFWNLPVVVVPSLTTTTTVGWIFFCSPVRVSRGSAQCNQPPLPEQSRWHFHRCHGKSGPDANRLGGRRLHGRLQQRWIRGHLLHFLRSKPSLSQ